MTLRPKIINMMLPLAQDILCRCVFSRDVACNYCVMLTRCFSNSLVLLSTHNMAAAVVFHRINNICGSLSLFVW